MSHARVLPRPSPGGRTGDSAPIADLDWAAAGWAGAAAGLAYIVLMAALTPLVVGGSPAAAVRAIAAIALGDSVLPPLSPFTALVFLAAAAVHLPLSLAYARLLAGMVGTWETKQAVAGGIAFGAILYLVNFYLFTDAFFPWFAAERGWATLLSHLAYGALAAYVYKRLTAPAAARPPA